MKTRRDVLIGGASLGGMALGLAALCSPARAQPAFPLKPVRIVTPFPGGSGPDAALRLVAERLSRQWSQPVHVENKPGGNGFIAVAAFKQGEVDGHALLQLDSNHCTTHPHMFGKLPYDLEKDFAPLGMMLRTPFFVAVGANSPLRSLDDIVAAAKVRRVTYGSWFTGSPGHIGALRLEAFKGVSMTHIPFRDFGQLYAAVANGEVDWALGSIASAGALERAGKLRFVALAAATRDPRYPEVPATAELPGLRGYEVTAWAALFCHKGVEPAVADRLAVSLAQALASPEVLERYRAIGYEAPAYTPQEFTRLIRDETAAWGETLRTANIRLD